MNKMVKTFIVFSVLLLALVSCMQSNPLLDTYWVAGYDMIHFKNETELDVYNRVGGDGTKLGHYIYSQTWTYVFDGEIITATEEDGVVNTWILKGDYMVLFEQDGVEVTAKKVTF